MVKASLSIKSHEDGYMYMYMPYTVTYHLNIKYRKTSNISKCVQIKYIKQELFSTCIVLPFPLESVLAQLSQNPS